MDTTNTYPRRVSEIVAEAMVAEGWSEKAMAEATGIPRVTLRRRLAGAAFNVAELAAIADALGTTVSALTDKADAA
jgi:transcriptional regulator with XRE-family HTH domain